VSDFTLPDEAGRLHRLGEFAGRRVILIFFRGSSCLECARQLQASRGIHDRLIASSVAVVAITSTTKQDLGTAQRALPEGKRLPFLLLADPEHAVFKKFGCVRAADEEPLHGTFLLDGPRKIRWHDIGGEPYVDVSRLLERATPGTSGIIAIPTLRGLCQVLNPLFPSITKQIRSASCRSGNSK
jgi:peroxiredoxin